MPHAERQNRNPFSGVPKLGDLLGGLLGQTRKRAETRRKSLSQGAARSPLIQQERSRQGITRPEGSQFGPFMSDIQETTIPNIAKLQRQNRTGPFAGMGPTRSEVMTPGQQRTVEGQEPSTAPRIPLGPQRPTEPAPSPALSPATQQLMDEGARLAQTGSALPQQNVLGTQVQAPPAQTTPPLQAQPPAPADQLSALERGILGTFEPTEEEQELQRQLADITGQIQQQRVATQRGRGLLADQAIATPLIGRQQRLLQQQAENRAAALEAQSVPLKTRLAQLQGEREAQRERAEQEREFTTPETVDPVTLGPGQRLIDPQTGREIAGVPETQKPIAVSEGQTLVDPETGRPIFLAPPKTANEASELLSIKEAEALGVPFGTTKGQAFGINPADIGESDITDNIIRAGQTVVRDADEALARLDQAPSFQGEQGIIAANRRSFFADNVKGSDEWEIASLIESVKSNIGIDTLLNIKREGAGLGQVPQQQLITLQSVLGQLDVARDPKLLKRDLQHVKELYTDIVQKAGGELLGGQGQNEERQFLKQQFPNLSDQEIDSLLQDQAGFNQDLSRSQKGSGKVLALGQITGFGSPLWKHGLDIDLKKGDPVPTPESGEVIFVGPNGGFGNQVKIRTARGNEIWLSHLDAADVRVGQRVSRGQIIGKGGNTGKTIPGPGGDGTHLDITVKRPDGSFIDPRRIASTLEAIEGTKARV